MKKLILTAVLFALVLNSSYSQINSNAITVDNAISGQNPFFDASTNFDPTLSFSNTIGKGLLFARTDLTSWVFNISEFGGGTFPTAFDGMIVYNTGTGNTLTTGNNPSASFTVAPGFYYFSNPTVDPNDFNPTVTLGEWLPLGGPVTTIKTAVITSVPADGENTVLDLAAGTGTIGTVTRFLEAKIYDSAGQLVLTASSNYVFATNVLTTGNGGVNTLLPAGSYTVVLAFQ
jgi:hypothetical protein